MRIQIGAAALAGAASLLAMGLYAPTATAGTNFTISVDDTSVTVEQTFTVTGSVPQCPSSPYTVTLTYTNIDDEVDTETAEGTTDGEGGFTQQMTVPADALPDEEQAADEPTPPSVQASVTCAEPTPSETATTTTTAPPPTGLSRTAALPAAAPMKAQQATVQSNTVTMSIVYATGVLTTDKASGMAGTVVNLSGTNCLGVEAFAVFANNDGADVFDVDLDEAANTLAADYTVPNFPPGEYIFGALCNGTEYNEVPFTLLATPGGPSPTPVPSETPPTPIAGPVNFTG